MAVAVLTGPSGMSASSANLRARVAGAFYVVTVVTGMFAEFFVRGRVTVASDAAATAHNILASEAIYRLAFVADLIGGAGYIVVTIVLYELLRPVNRTVALLAVFFSLIGSAVGVVVGLAHLAPLLLLGGAQYLSAFDAAQLQALALLSLKLHSQGYLIGLTFFGVFEVLVGCLMLGSRIFPKWLGVLLAAGGLAFVINSLLLFASPPLGRALNPYLLNLDAVAEIVLTLWLLIMGVNAKKWETATETESI